MTNKLTKLIAAASERLDMPVEEIAGLPVIRLRGFHELLIENHKGIREYGEERIVIASNSGMIRLLGAGMCVTSMNEREMTITGGIISLELDTSTT